MQHIPWHGARTCKVSRKYINVFSSYSAKTKRDGRTNRWTDGRGALQYLPSRDFGAAGDNDVIFKHTGTFQAYMIYAISWNVLDC